MVEGRDMVRFLRCISRRELREADGDFIADFLKRDLPWEHLLMLAKNEGVDGLLCHHLIGSGLMPPPGSVLRQLKERDREITNYSLAAITEAKSLSARLSEAGFSVIALQGLSLIRIYRDPGLRPFVDGDFLVRPRHKERLRGLLGEAGFQRAYPAYPDLFEKGGIWFDIHTHILNIERIRARRYLFPEDISPMWERATPLFERLDGLLRMDPADNFIALCAHALKHSYSRLIWLVDLYELLTELTREADGWEGVVERALSWRQERTVLYSLLMLEGILWLRVPEWVRRELGSEGMGLVERHLIRLKLKGFSSDQLCNALWLCCIKGFPCKVRFLRETLFPRDEIMAQIFPEDQGKRRMGAVARRAAETLRLLWDNMKQALDLHSM